MNVFSPKNHNLVDENQKDIKKQLLKYTDIKYQKNIRSDDGYFLISIS
ncbi:hypothetical protein F957_01294 [Acinetobacter gyllenbergii CIP 110306 = MTCC 11365]|uniref:Uncharacterized protein n=1 Tax=Acinetobacter gyllenbergii CIP 110306 = MTCC 11365 TaxID=1217657 RepID=A0A829HLD7_9GAMM|nr:hypothetical protein F957_01294 [Acinetobacter gyllenbergii CIP 110306 = MTCC 11365]ESK55279.1 hypothetical protein F987_00598 [Acinetobacter gyllenbergii NIPH 230]